MSPVRRTHEDYTIAWICPLPFEKIAAAAMLDERHPHLSPSPYDQNNYVLGSINGHNVVIASLCEGDATEVAAGVAIRIFRDMKETFVALKLLLLVGVSGGVPTKTSEGDVMLGHVVVCKDTPSGLLKFDYQDARSPNQGFFRDMHSFAMSPSRILCTAAERLDIECKLASDDPLARNVERVTSKPQLQRYRYPGALNDRLYRSSYRHVDMELPCDECCDVGELVRRHTDGDIKPWVVVHRGAIAVGPWDKSLFEGSTRDGLAAADNILCFDRAAMYLLDRVPASSYEESLITRIRTRMICGKVMQQLRQPHTRESYFAISRARKSWSVMM